MSEKVIRVERGWGGHFIGGAECLFRRNTLVYLEGGKNRYVVSTVGNYRPPHKHGHTHYIGVGGACVLHDDPKTHRYYETRVFKAQQIGPYWDADVTKPIWAEVPWAITAGSLDELPDNVDSLADEMHEKVVEAIEKVAIRKRVVRRLLSNRRS